MNEFLKNSKNFIAVWSERYPKSRFCMAELQSAFYAWSKGTMDCLLPVRIDNHPLEPLYAGLVYVNLPDRSAASKTKLAKAVRDAIEPWEDAETLYEWGDDDYGEDDVAQYYANIPAQLQQPVIACEAGSVLAPVHGKVISYTEIPDPTFAAGVLGAGVGIWPDEGVVRAPYDGIISSLAWTQHAVGITGPGDMEVLIHIGVDTVAMNGDGFTALVQEDDEVKAGQPLIKFDRAKIKAANHPDVVVTLLTNSDDYAFVSYPSIANS